MTALDQKDNEEALDDKTVSRVAKLAALSLGGNDIKQTREELNEILSYIAKLRSISTIGVIPTSHVHGAVNAFRDDIVKMSFSIEEVSANAPDFVSSGYRVPKIIG